MVFVHVLVGLVVIAPFLIFGIAHLITARNRPNRVAVRLGIFVFLFGIVVCVTGVLLVQSTACRSLPTAPASRTQPCYWLHSVVPVLAVAAYVHAPPRRAGNPVEVGLWLGRRRGGRSSR